jgi:hypothetical protein
MPITWRLVHHIADDPRPCADLSATRKYHTPSRLINLLRMTVTLCPYMLQGLKKIGGGGGATKCPKFDHFTVEQITLWAVGWTVKGGGGAHGLWLYATLGLII